MKHTTSLLFSFFLFFYLTACFQQGEQSTTKPPSVNLDAPDLLYYQTLPIDSPEVIAHHISRELQPHWWSGACEGFFFWLPDSVGDAYLLRLLDSYDKVFSTDSIIAFSQLMRGRIFIEQAIFDTALYCLQDCYTISQRSGRTSRAIDAVRLIGRCYMKKGNFPQGIEFLLKAFEEYELLFPKGRGSGSRNLETMIEIAGAYQTIQNFEKAHEWYEKAWQTSCEMRSTGYQITTAGRLAGNYLELGKIGDAKYMIDTAFYLQNKYNNPYNEAERYYILACIEKTLGYHEKALAHFKYAHIKNEVKDNIFIKYKYLSGIGEGFAAVGKYDSAMHLYQGALATPDSLQKAKILDLIAQTFTHLGKYQQALAYQQQSNDLKNRLFTAEKNKAIGYLEAKNEMNQKEWQFKQQEQQFKIKRLNTLLVIVFLFFILIIMALWSVRQHQKRVILEQEMQIIKTHEQLRIQELTQTTQNLNAKLKALDAAQKVIALKNTLIEELELQKQDDKQEKNINIFRNTQILTAEDWHKFRNLFDKTFPEFDEQQKTQLPSLTAAEIRLLMLLKVGFNNAEIAYALGISIESVYKSRYRLRRKISVLEDFDLERFAKNF